MRNQASLCVQSGNLVTVVEVINNHHGPSKILQPLVLPQPGRSEVVSKFKCRKPILYGIIWDFDIVQELR